MKENLKILTSCPLFYGIAADDIMRMLDCLRAHTRSYLKNETVLLAGEAIDGIGIVLSGRVQIWREEIPGERTIISQVERGGLFGEAFVCAGVARLPVTVASVSDSEIMRIDYRRILTLCPSACAFHAGLIRNMMMDLAQKNIAMNIKIRHLAKRTTREKLISYLSQQAQSAQSLRFDIPFNRQELAEYLCVDRSAMSAELGKMRGDGFLEFSKNHFVLHPERFGLIHSDGEL
jgi:CRP-like cAMP-binding protein